MQYVTGNSFATVARYWHTLRHLRPVQVYGRVWFRAARPRPDIQPAPSLRRCTGRWVLPARRTPSLLADGRLRFLNEARDIAAHGWDDPGLALLWRYNLHYFDDLNAWDAGQRTEAHQRLLKRWVRENHPAEGTGWQPYPSSLRIVNWIKWHLGGAYLSNACLDSLATQTRWLRKRLEYHLLGNHLFVNAKALVFAGFFFEGCEAYEWLKKGIALLVDQIPEQILADGGQFERSPMYHALAFEDVLDLINITNAFAGAVPRTLADFVASLPELAGRMHTWLRSVCHPDGEIGFFNDAAIGIAPSPTELGRYACNLGVINVSDSISAMPHDRGVRCIHLKESGYIRGETSNAVLLMDVAQIGPD